MRQGAEGWCTGMTQRHGMGMEVGGGFRMWNTRTPMADSCQCMAKPLQYCKVISRQLNKFILKKRNVKSFVLSVMEAVSRHCSVDRVEIWMFAKRG